MKEIINELMEEPIYKTKLYNVYKNGLVTKNIQEFTTPDAIVDMATKLAEAEKTIEELKEEMKLAPLCVRGCEVDCEIKTLRYKLKLKDKVMELMLDELNDFLLMTREEILKDLTAQAIKEMEKE